MPAALDHAAPVEWSAARPRTSVAAGAFTLIELLVAISIIAVLATLLIAVVGSVRSSAKQVQCASNLRQIGVLVLSHLADEKRLPPPVAACNWPFGNLTANGGWGSTPTAAAAMFIDGWIDTPRVFYCPQASMVTEWWWNLENPSKTAQNQTPSDFWYCYIGYCWWANYQRGDVPGIARNRWSSADSVIASDLSFPAASYVGGNHVAENGECRGGNTLSMDGHVAWKRFADMSWKMNYYMDFYF